jgi:peptidoglycan/LPS O-acetylase OafA/YrhL
VKTLSRVLEPVRSSTIDGDAPRGVAPSSALREGKIAAADAIRALAIFSVVAYHVAQMAQPTWHGQPHVFFEIGVWGVDCFFVLSGFLLGGEYIRRLVEPAITLQPARLFWKKRILRIVPLYFACVLISAIFDGTLAHAFPSVRDIGAHLLFLHDFSATMATSINGPFWTMPIDMEFYLLLPLYGAMMAWLFRAVPKLPREPVLFASLALITVAGLVYRYYEIRYNPAAIHSFSEEVVWVRNVIGMSGAFSLGAALALVSLRKVRPSPLASVLLLAVAVACEAVVEHTSSLDAGPVTTHLIIGQTLFDFVGALSAALVMYVVIEGDFSFLNRFVKLRAISEIALLAYGVYLLHFPIAQFVTPFFAHFSSIERLAGIGLATIVPTFILAFFANRLIEKPFLTMKARLRA